MEPIQDDPAVIWRREVGQSRWPGQPSARFAGVVPENVRVWATNGIGQRRELHLGSPFRPTDTLTLEWLT